MQNAMNKLFISIVTGLLVLTSCTQPQLRECAMFPDYQNVTIPQEIAPLNFFYYGKGAGMAVTRISAGNIEYKFRGRTVQIPTRKWRKLIRESFSTPSQYDSADLGIIRVHSSLTGDWEIYVTKDPIDPYITYRLIEPGYEVWNQVEIRQRDIRNFDETVIATHSNTDNSCMNCHIHSGKNSMFYLRGDKGGAILSRDGEELRKLALKTEELISGTVYGELHPSGKWGVFSTNIIIPGFHLEAGKRLEVFDTESDLCTVNFNDNFIVNSPNLARKDRLETFPCWSSDGKQVYYCVADTLSLPKEIENLKYSLAMADFDSATGILSNERIIWDAEKQGGSACHPKASKDGKWLMFTRVDYGTFPIWHKECSLMMMNLENGEILTLEELKGDASSSYHSWSSSSKWIVFASKRGDGVYGKPYFSHLGEDGHFSKPFVLPQLNPRHYVKTLKSYNIPDFGEIAVPFDAEDIARLREVSSAEIFTSK